MCTTSAICVMLICDFKMFFQDFNVIGKVDDKYDTNDVFIKKINKSINKESICA